MVGIVEAPPPALVQKALMNELVKRSFVEFLKHCRIHTDDPHNPSELAFEPRDYQLERAFAWEKHRSEVIVKPRQMGFSWEFAAYMAWRGIYHGWNIAYYSKDDDAATAEIEQRLLYIVDRLPSWMPKKYRTRRSIVFFTDSGGMVHPFPATQMGGASYTFQCVIADEAALHKYGTENYAFYKPTLSAGGQFIAASSSSNVGPFGFFFELWTKAQAGISGYDPVFIPWWKHPDRNQAWFDKMLSEHVGSEKSFRSQYPATPDDAFQNDSGLVYADMSRERHVKKADWTWEQADIRVVAVDPGGNDPTAIIPLAYRHTGTAMEFHVFGEFYKRGPVSMMDIGDFLQRINSVAPIHRVVVDPSNTLAVPTLKGMGWPARNADNDKLAGIGQVAQLLRSNLLTIDPACEELLYEFQTYWFVDRRDMVSGATSAVMTRTPATHHADGLDALRYAVLETMRLTNRAPQGQPVRMVWR